LLSVGSSMSCQFKYKLLLNQFKNLLIKGAYCELNNPFSDEVDNSFLK